MIGGFLLEVCDFLFCIHGKRLIRNVDKQEELRMEGTGYASKESGDFDGFS